MTICKCGAELHRDFPDKTERCSGCDRTPAWCRCVKTVAKYVPVWMRNVRAKELVA